MTAENKTPTNKLPDMTKDLADENIAKLAELFPGVVTETTDASGKVVRAVDFDALRSELGEVVEGDDERYQFTWPDKRRAIALANTPVELALRPCVEESVDWADTENIYIKGDNLDALKILRETYLGRVKMIYIDPPYNTGSDFVYRDDFSMTADEYREASGQYDEDGGRLFQNTESNGRFHTDWLNMIYPRLRVAKSLLSDDGVIFISIDDHEVHNLRKICDEIFGAQYFIANIAWQRTYSIRNDSKGIPAEVEHILVYSKSIWEPERLPRTEKMNAAYSNPDGDKSPWMSGSPVASDAATHQGMVYAIQHPFTGELFYPSDKAHWRYSQEQMLAYMSGWCDYKLEDLHDDEERARICGISKQDIRKNVKAIVLADTLENSSKKAQIIYEKGPWPRFYFTDGGRGGIRRKVYLSDVGGKIATNFWSFEDVGHTDEAKKEVKSLFDGSAPFDTPKPTRLLDRILSIATDKESIILDFFSGSATTAHAVFAKNIEDQGHRKFILVQIPEIINNPHYKTICDIGMERIRRAGKKIREEHPDAKDLDTGFRVFEVATSNMNDVRLTPDELTEQAKDRQIGLFDDMVDNVKADRTPLDLLIQSMLTFGIELSAKIEERTIDGKHVYIVDPETNQLIACFDENVTEETVKAIAEMHPIRFVTRDLSMEDDSVSLNFEQLLAAHSPDQKIDWRVI